jgi:hypothetical protein
MDSSCELLRCLDDASGSVRLLPSTLPHSEKHLSTGVTFRDVLLGFACRWRCEKTLEAHRWVYGEARRALL